MSIATEPAFRDGEGMKLKVELLSDEEADPTLAYVSKVSLQAPVGLPDPWNSENCDPLMVAIAHLVAGQWEWAAYDDKISINARDLIGACLVDNDVPVGQWRYIRLLEVLKVN